jgi:branched-chain amino acid transport system ATP-binding protein
MLLEIKNLRVFYDKVEAVRNVSLHVGEEEFVTIIGANGAGKTSTLNAISGIVDHEGEIWLKGERIDNLSPAEIASKGVIQIPEGRRLFPLLSVMDNLRMGAYLRKNDSDVAASMERVFTLFPVLKERAKQRADSLSGGEQQMLALGRALMAGPTLLMMDEPSLGLSPLFCQRLSDTCLNINQEGMAILLVEQNARMGLKLSDRAYVFEKGEVVLEGKSQELAQMADIKKAYLGV